ncbi:MAG: hypothetical protein ABR589_04475 [Chthoniobacterales bacterium]
MKREDDQELWDLLGKASEPRLSPFFARNVLREIRQESSWQEHLWQWLRFRRLIPATAVAVVVLASAVSLWRPSAGPSASEGVPEAVAQLDEVDYEVVADLDDLLAWDEDTLWTENETSTL